MADIVVNCHWCHTEFMEMLVKMQSHVELFRMIISEYFVGVFNKIVLCWWLVKYKFECIVSAVISASITVFL